MSVAFVVFVDLAAMPHKDFGRSYQTMDLGECHLWRATVMERGKIHYTHSGSYNHCLVPERVFVMRS